MYQHGTLYTRHLATQQWRLHPARRPIGFSPTRQASHRETLRIRVRRVELLPLEWRVGLSAPGRAQPVLCAWQVV